MILLQTSERDQWISASTASLAHEYPKPAQRTVFYTDSAGLTIYKPNASSSTPDRIYVPLHRASETAPFDKLWRNALIRKSHEETDICPHCTSYRICRSHIFGPECVLTSKPSSNDARYVRVQKQRSIELMDSLE